MQLIDKRFDIVDRRSQAAFEAGFLIQTEPNLLFDDRGEMRLVLLQRAAHGCDLTRQSGLASSHYLSAERLRVGDGSSTDLNLAVGLLVIVAEQKVLFRPPAFQQL